MGGQDKLEASLAGRPLLRWAVETFASSVHISDVVVVTSAPRVASLQATPWLADLGARLVAGGARRQDSVAAGLRATNADVVLVHDAARPLVSRELIERVIDGVLRYGAAIPVIPVVDALKRVEGAAVGGSISGTAERTGLFGAQTPQGARRELLLAAADRHAGGTEELRDEAELLARDGVSVSTVAGDPSNLKVTVPDDLALARRLVGQRDSERSAIGRDSHPFGSAAGLHLGGLLIEGAPRLHGHSDGDVVLHALCSALLAASGSGDLGRFFPAGDPATKDIDSRVLLAQVVGQLADAGLAVRSIDVAITGARPRLGGRRLDAMGQAIAEMTGTSPARVSVSAGTGNLSGDEGAGRAISASCLVSVAPR
jgi:2-C-methyl-D-erythritol 4-phosphate cytidylyltransferase/2-C-methyl-D-erythritol 2,4-cyclodiphosphate synthase